MFEKNKEKMKEKMEPDKVLRFAIVAVILLFLIGALIIGTRMMNPRVDATEGVKKLTELEDANVQKIDAKIQELEQTEADEAAAWKAKSAKEKMDGCETVTEGEILDAIRRPLGAKSLDGVKRRTRAGMGRCQSGFCSPRTMEILSRELGISMEEITKTGGASRLIEGINKKIAEEGENHE